MPAVTSLTHTQAPNSHKDVRQTESLMLRANGDYIENKGVKPDVEIAVNESSDTKYDKVLLKAIDLLTNKKAPGKPEVKPTSSTDEKPGPKPTGNVI